MNDLATELLLQCEHSVLCFGQHRSFLLHLLHYVQLTTMSDSDDDDNSNGPGFVFHIERYEGPLVDAPRRATTEEFDQFNTFLNEQGQRRGFGDISDYADDVVQFLNRAVPPHRINYSITSVGPELAATTVCDYIDDYINQLNGRIRQRRIQAGQLVVEDPVVVQDRAQPLAGNDNNENDNNANNVGNNDAQWCGFCQAIPCLWVGVNGEALVAEVQDMRASNPTFTNRQARYLLYRNFVNAIHGYLGANIRRKLPECITHRIRNNFPADMGQGYVGFREAGPPRDVDNV